MKYIISLMATKIPERKYSYSQFIDEGTKM